MNKLKFYLNIQFFSEDDQADPKPEEKKKKADFPDVAKKIQEIKDGMVPREEYDKVVQELEKTMELALSGAAPKPSEEEDQDGKPKKKTFKTRDPREIAKEFLGENITVSNLDFAAHALELRSAVLERTGTDVFLPNGSEYQITEDDRKAAQTTADVLQEVVDMSDGNPKMFQAYLDQALRDTKGPRRPR